MKTSLEICGCGHGAATQAYMDRFFFYMQLCQVELSVANCDDTADKEIMQCTVYMLYLI